MNRPTVHGTQHGLLHGSVHRVEGGLESCAAISPEIHAVHSWSGGVGCLSHSPYKCTFDQFKFEFTCSKLNQNDTCSCNEARAVIISFSAPFFVTLQTH